MSNIFFLIDMVLLCLTRPRKHIVHGYSRKSSKDVYAYATFKDMLVSSMKQKHINLSCERFGLEEKRIKPLVTGLNF